MSDAAFDTAAHDKLADSIVDTERHPAVVWLSGELSTQRLLFGLTVVFAVTTYFLAQSAGRDFLDFFYVYFMRTLRALVLVASAALLLVTVQALVRHRDDPIRHIRATMLSVGARRYVGRFMFYCLVLNVIMACFLFHKTYIPELHPFSWDSTFAEWDRAIFLGYEPWRILHPVLGYYGVTIAMDILYSAWVPAVFVIWGYIGASRTISPDLKRQYFLSTLMAWVLIGLVAATLLSSAGPCFLPGIAPDTAVRYAELNAYLDEVAGTFTLSTQLSKQFLWGVYSGSLDGAGGISAMPSMHNAQAALFAVVGYRINRRLGHLLLAYAFIIFLGSIHLAWHYAVDGFVGVVLALVIWFAVGAALKLSRRRALA